MARQTVVLDVYGQGSEEAAIQYVRKALKGETNVTIRKPRDGHEIRVSEQPTREQLAEWTEPW